MSEFSESYHLKGDVADAVATLDRSGLAGWVLPGEHGWTTIVVDRDFTGEVDEPLADASEGVLVLYVFAEDHGWTIAVHRDGRQLAQSEAEWTFDRSLVVVGAPVAELATVLDADPSVVAGVFEQRDIDEPPDGALPAFVAALGLSNLDWMSGAYLRQGDDTRLERDGVVRVDG